MRKKTDWALRVWANMKWGEWYTASEAYSLILQAPFSCRDAPVGTRALSSKLSRSGYFYRKWGSAPACNSSSPTGHSIRTVRFYRKKKLW